jgi:8-oxo-dGTP pyrophosphatase MutT (NUDIX family)
MNLSVVAIDELDLSLVPWQWPFALARRGEIDAYFAERRARTPQLWNGRVLLAKDCRIDRCTLTGACFETDFASFLAWRDWGFPDPAVTNCFAMGALKSSDGAFILGVMGKHTANPGRIYFPAGTPDPTDAAGGRVDLAGNIVREVAEETGLGPDDYAAEPGWHAVASGSRMALLRILAAHERAAALCRRIRAHIAAQAAPELADVVVVRGAADFHADMPPFVAAYLMHVLRTPVRGRN